MSQSPIDRRNFGHKLITAGAALVAGQEAVAQADDSKPDKRKPAQAAAKDAPAEDKPGQEEKVRAEDLIVQLVEAAYPLNLDEANLRQIRQQVAVQLVRSRILSNFPLTNADEPAPTFRAYRGAD